MAVTDQQRLAEIEAAAAGGDARAQLALGAHFLETAAWGSEAFQKALDWLTRAAEQQFAEAEWTLGNVYAHFARDPGGAAKAVEWYTKAAERHCVPAQNRLADLYMTGRGVAADDRRAFHWYAQGARLAFPVAQANLAYMHAHGIGTPRDPVEATNWYLRAAMMGNARACFNLGLRYAAGDGAPQSPIHSWAWFSNAERRAYPLAGQLRQNLERELDAEALVLARGLAERIEANFHQLRAALGPRAEALDPADATAVADFNNAVEQHFAQLGEPALSPDPAVRAAAGPLSATPANAPAPARMLSVHPRVFAIDDFAAPDECAHVMASAAQHLATADHYHLARGSAEATAFTGEAMVFDGPLCDATLRNIERRIALAARMPLDHIEPLSVLRYASGREYSAHVDFFDARQLRDNETSKGDRGGQRLMTFLICLRAPEAGGETEYIKTGLKVGGRAGAATLHYNCLPNGEPDEMTLHRGCPIVSGEKWLLRTAIRAHSLYSQSAGQADRL